MKYLLFCILLAAVVYAAPTHNIVTPVILPKVHVASPDVTVVKQPYIIHQTEPVFRQVYYTDPLSLSVPYVSQHVTYHQQPAIYHQTPYVPSINYVA